MMKEVEILGLKFRGKAGQVYKFVSLLQQVVIETVDTYDIS